MNFDRRYVCHVTESQPGIYLGAIWEVPLLEGPLTAEDTRGFPRKSLREIHHKTTYRGDYTIKAPIKSAFGLPEDDFLHVVSWPGESGALHVIVYAIFVEFSGGDAQTLMDMGLDPDSTTAEDFFQATGEWPADAEASARLEMAVVPSEYKNIVADVRTMQDDDWSIAQIVGPDEREWPRLERDMKKKLEVALKRDGVELALRNFHQEHDSSFFESTPIRMFGQEELW